MMDNELSPRLRGDVDSDLGGDKELELADSEPEPSESKKGIFIRLSPQHKEILEDAKETQTKGASGQRTYSGVIEKLLEYYGRQESQVKTKILAGILSNPLKESEDLLAMLHRAQHAFETRRFYFAIRTYLAIARRLDSDDSSAELLEVCYFRLAHCWNLLSYRLRAEALSYDPSQPALKSKFDELYHLALRSVEKAVGYLEKLNEDGDELMRLIKHFNMACCYSLRAQYIVESKLDPNEPQVEAGLSIPLRDFRQDRKKTEELWLNSLGKIWGALDKDGSAKAAADEGFEWLTKIDAKTGIKSARPTSKDSKVKSENIWIVNEAREDPDFLFLRSAEKWKSKFDQWEITALEGASIATAIEALLEE